MAIPHPTTMRCVNKHGIAVFYLVVIAILCFLCQPTIADMTSRDAASSLATQFTLNNDVTALRERSLIISEFKGIHLKDDSLPSAFQEMLMTAFIKAKLFSVVERTQLNKALVELKIQSSGLTDAVTQKQIGKLTGAEYILVGSLSQDQQHTITVNMRLVSIETGISIAAADTTFVAGIVDTNGSKSPSAVPSSALFRDDEAGYSLQFPLSWRIKREDSSRVSAEYSLTNGGITYTNVITITSDVTTPRTTLASYATAKIAACNTYAHFQLFTQPNDYIQAGIPMKWISFGFTANNYQQKELQYYCMNGRYAYTIACVALDEEFDLMLPYFQRVVETFRVQTPAPYPFNKWVNVVNRGDHYSMQMPTQWVAVTTPPYLSASCSVVDGDAYIPCTISIKRTLEPISKPTLDRTEKVSLGLLPLSYKNAKVLADPDDVVKNDIPMRRFYLTWEEQGQPRKSVHFLCVNGRRWYSIVCTTTPEAFDGFLPVFEKIIGTFTPE
ncbi:MAG TPA: FlgO family outer membrane protein [Armatimonadota bacterium]|nr:FlgO family outer membrane protein [Armatimonadota bacterium]